MKVRMGATEYFPVYQLYPDEAGPFEVSDELFAKWNHAEELFAEVSDELHSLWHSIPTTINFGGHNETNH